MTKPANFPERKRQRQISALARLKDRTAKKVIGVPTVSDAVAIALLTEATSHGSKRDVRTKKDRTLRGRMFRTA